MSKIGILIVDDQRAIIDKFAHIIASVRDMEVLAAVSSGYEGVLEAALIQPDIILMDKDMETNQCGIRAAQVINSRFPEMKIILLIDNEEKSVIQSAYKAGIVDYIPKNAPSSEIIRTLRGVHRLRHPGEQAITDKFYRRTLHPEGVRDSFMYTLTVVSQLTPIELEITKLIVEGRSANEIAEIRKTNIESIQESINRILNKFNKNSINELIKVLQTLSIMDLLNHIF